MLSDRDELRIQVVGMFAPPNSAPHPGKNSFCLNSHCIHLAIQKDQRTGTHFYPPFDGRVAIDANFYWELLHVFLVEGVYGYICFLGSVAFY